MKINALKNQRGVTLLEVLVAILLTSFSLLMLLNMGMIALDGNDWSNKTTVATQALQEKLEQLRGGGYASLASGSDTTGGLKRSWTVSSVGSHLRQVVVKVAWDDIKGDEHVNEITAYIRTDSI
jgi:Tfp pilus assembly protein PilV